LDKVLDFLTRENRLEYKIFDDVIMLRKSSDYDELVSTQSYKTSYHLKGKVVDAQGNNPMGYATIAIDGSTIGTYTDEEGNFDIEIPAKYSEANITIQYLGYDDQLYKIAESENIFLLVPLNISATNISEITIINRELDIKISDQDQAMVINNTQVQSSTSGLAGNDFARNLQLLPGLNATDDTSAEIKIRGSNSDETLLILDGIPVYNASHYYGIFSSINSNYIESINLYKNTFPIQYGGKSAGVVEINSKNQLSDRLSLVADINLLTGSANLTVPLTQKSNLLLSGRTTIGDISNTNFNSFSPQPREPIRTQNFVDNTINTGADPDFNFYDINAKYLWQHNENSTFSLNFYSSDDDLSVESILRGEKMTGQKVDLITNTEEYWNSLGASVIYQTIFNNNLKFDGRIYYSKYSNQNFTDITILDKRAQLEETEVGATQNNSLRDLGVNFKVSKSYGKNNLSLGLDAVQHDVVYQFIENNKNSLNGDDTVSELTPFLAYDIKLSDKLNFNIGGRGSYYEGTDKVYYSPRLSINYQPADALKLKGSYSINQQFIRELNYEYRGQLYKLWVQGNQNSTPIINSKNSMLGVTARLGKFLVDVEVYHKDMTGMIEFAVVNPTGQPPNQNLPSRYDTFIGNGRSRGIDLLLSTNFKNYDTYLSYTLSKTQHSFEEIRRGEYFDSEDDRTHQLKWINEYHLGDFSFGANWIYSTGRLYTDLKAFSNNEDIRDISPTQRNKRLPSYKRLDLSTTYALKFGENKASLSLSLFNALDYQNVKYEQLVESRSKEDSKPLNSVLGTTTNLLNRTLNLSFKIDLK